MNKNKKNKTEPKIKKSIKTYKKNEIKVNIINPIKSVPKISNHILVTF
jgi:hypothetical protein